MDRKFRIEATDGSAQGEQWCDSLDEVGADLARRLALDPADVATRRVAVSLDPIVVVHEGARWRSRAAWRYRAAADQSGGTAPSARVYEMVRIDEAQYDH
jgi:hypothetical protein